MKIFVLLTINEMQFIDLLSYFINKKYDFFVRI